MTEVELTIESQRKEPSSFRLIGTLGLAGMISGLALATVFQVTEPIIQANNQRELEAAVLEVVPGATAMQPEELTDEAGNSRTVYAAFSDSGAFLGYAIESESAGFADKIRLIYGYDPSSDRIIGMKVLECLETPGLGDKIKKDKDPAFSAQFDDLAIRPSILVVKDGKDKDFEIDAITGATISSKAVVKAINAANEGWIEHLPETPPARRDREAASGGDREAASGEPNREAASGGGGGE